MTTEDVTKLEKAIYKVRSLKDWRNSTGEPFLFRASLRHPIVIARRDADILLSEYWEEGVVNGEYGRSIEELLDGDRAQAEAVAVALRNELGAVFPGERVVFLAGPDGVSVTPREGAENAEYELAVGCYSW